MLTTNNSVKFVSYPLKTHHKGLILGSGSFRELSKEMRGGLQKISWTILAQSFFQFCYSELFEGYIWKWAIKGGFIIKHSKSIFWGDGLCNESKRNSGFIFEINKNRLSSIFLRLCFIFLAKVAVDFQTLKNNFSQPKIICWL